MKRRGMTRKQLARELGINTTTVGRWLNGCGDPTPRALHHIGTILGLRLIGTGPADNDSSGPCRSIFCWRSRHSFAT